MLPRRLLVALLCAPALITAPAVANAASPVTFSVFGTVASQQIVDVPGADDVQVLSGPLLSTSGAPIGSWSARVRFTSERLASVQGAFRLGAGTIFARGAFDPTVGPPPLLEVFAGSGVYRQRAGTLTVGNAGQALMSFTFRLWRHVPFHPGG